MNIFDDVSQNCLYSGLNRNHLKLFSNSWRHFQFPLCQTMAKVSNYFQTTSNHFELNLSCKSNELYLMVVRTLRPTGRTQTSLQGMFNVQRRSSVCCTITIYH